MFSSVLVLEHAFNDLFDYVLQGQGDVVPTHVDQFVVQVVSALEVFEVLQVVMRSYIFEMQFLL